MGYLDTPYYSMRIINILNYNDFMTPLWSVMTI